MEILKPIIMENVFIIDETNWSSAIDQWENSKLDTTTKLIYDHSQLNGGLIQEYAFNTFGMVVMISVYTDRLNKVTYKETIKKFPDVCWTPESVIAFRELPKPYKQKED